MSVGGNSGMGSVADEYSDLEHQVIRQAIVLEAGQKEERTPGDAGAEFEPGERELDREEVAQLVAYRRFASMEFIGADSDIEDLAASDTGNVDASIGINGDLFRDVTTESNVTSELNVFKGGEIGLLDHYNLTVNPTRNADLDKPAGPGTEHVEFAIDYYDWPTGGPVVDSFDTITCGFASGNDAEGPTLNIDLRYDLYWDVVETGETTSPFGRP